MTPARQALAVALAIFTGARILAGPAAAPDYAAEGQRWWSHIEYLAGDKLEGRNTGSPGHRKAAEYIAAEFERAGLRPAGTHGYFQPVAFETRQIDESKSSLQLSLDGRADVLKLGEDANLVLRGDPAPHTESDAVFVGYGLQAPEVKYDDLAGLDLRGKVAVILTGAPGFIPGPLAAHLQSAERWKRLRAAGAVGVATFGNPKHTDVPWARATLARLQPAMIPTDPALTAEQAGLRLSIVINPAHANRWFTGTGHSAEEILGLAEANKPLPKFPLRVKVQATTVWRTERVSSDNVAAILPGSDPALRNEYVALSAHLDHLGVGGEVNGDRIYNGAMDDASGVASILEVARLVRERGVRPKRSLLFVAVTGEEKGLVGSRYFAEHPTVTPEQIVADINLDMYLPLFPLKNLVVYGLDESDLGDLARETAKTMGIGVVGDREPKRNIFVRSDQYSFIRHGIPAITFKFDAEPGSPEEQALKEWIRVRYHSPSDDIRQPVDRAAAARFDEFVLHLTERVSDRANRPQWNASSFFRRFKRG